MIRATSRRGGLLRAASGWAHEPLRPGKAPSQQFLRGEPGAGQAGRHDGTGTFFMCYFLWYSPYLKPTLYALSTTCLPLANLLSAGAAGHLPAFGSAVQNASQ
jgi:hypothetical protein